MARFPYYPKNVKALGELLAKASQDLELANKLQNNPTPILRSIGLPEQATELLNFRVVKANDWRNAKALPYRLNSEKLRQQDSDYVAGVARLLC